MVEIVPDTKDWTWVLDRVCPECGFDVRSLPPDRVGATIRSNAAEWESILDNPPEALRARRRPDRWSPLEYAAHVRDVYALYLHRLELMLTEDDPEYPNWDQDETAVAEDYNSQDPKAVAVALVEAAARLAHRFDTLDAAQWDRPGRRSDGARFTVTSFARYLVHDPVHHLWDVTGS